MASFACPYLGKGSFMRVVPVVSLALTGFAFLVLASCTAKKEGDEVSAKGSNGVAKASKSEPVKEPTIQEKLLGKWEATKGEIPPGSTFDFGKDGKLKITIKVEGKEISDESAYKVEAQTIKTTHKEGPKDVTETLKIKTLTDKILITEDEKGKIDEFKKR
jgi:uncharacterized protein (TIGR03066 family)